MLQNLKGTTKTAYPIHIPDYLVFIPGGGVGEILLTVKIFWKQEKHKEEVSQSEVCWRGLILAYELQLYKSVNIPVVGWNKPSVIT